MTDYSHHLPDDVTEEPGAPETSGEGPMGGPGRVFGQFFFSALFCVSLALLVHDAMLSQRAREKEPRGPGAFRFGESMEWQMRAKALIAFDSLEEHSKGQMPFYAKLAAWEAPDSLKTDNPFALRRALILAGHLGRDAEAADLARRLDRAPHQSPIQVTANELLRRIYLDKEPVRVPDEEVESLERSLGWFGRIVKTDHLLLAAPEQGQRENEALRRECLRSAVAMAIVCSLGFMAFLLGTLLILLFSHRSSAGRVNWRGVAPAMRPWLAFETFTLYLCGFAALLILGKLARGATAGNGAENPAAGGLALIEVLWLLACPILVFWPALRGVSTADVRRASGLMRGRGFFREGAIGLLGYIGIIPVAVLGSVMAAAIGVAVGQSVSEHPLAPILAGHPPLSEVAFLLFLAVAVAPITEEIFFRGMFYGWLRSRMSAPAAVAVSALVFASLHPQGLLGVPVLMALGIGFAILREWRGSLIAPMVAHALVNGVTTVILLSI